MNALFGSLTRDNLEESEDRLGGFQPLDTNIYTGPIKAAYAGQSAAGARNVTIIAELGGREYRETIFVTNRKGENYFLNKNDNTKKVSLPGFEIIDDICLVATGKPLAEQESEEKIVNVYDPEAKKELPKSVPMLTELIGQVVSLGIVRQLENKSEKVGDEYIPTAETRESNFIDKVFHGELKLTVSEAKRDQKLIDEGKEPLGAQFHDKWLDRNKDQIRDKRTVKDGEAGKSGRPGGANRSAPQAGAKSERKSLFANA